MKFTITIRPFDAEGVIDKNAEPQVEVFGDELSAGEFVAGYIDDENRENPGCSTQCEEWLAFADHFAGMATHADYFVDFQGERIAVEIRYDSLQELLDAWFEAEHIAAARDPEGPAEADIAGVLEEMQVSLLAFGDEHGPWRMAMHAPAEIGDFVESQTSVLATYYVNGKYTQWPCSLGTVTIWQGE